MTLPRNSRLLLCTVSLALAGLSLTLRAQQPDAMTAEDRRLFADGLFSRGLHVRAIAEYEALAHDFPAMPEIDKVLFRWAEALRQADKFAEADKVLLRLIRDHAQSPYRQRALFQRAALAIVQDNNEAAAELLATLLKEELPPDIREHALYYRAEALRQLGSDAEAASLFDRQLEEFPAGKLAGYARLARGGQLVASAKAADFKRGIELFRACADNPPTPRLGAEALYLMAQAHFAAREYKASADLYREFMRRHPDDERVAKVALQAAWAYHNAGLHTDAIALTRTLGPAAGSDSAADWLYLKGSSEFQLAQYAEAAATFEKLVQQHPTARFSGTAWYMRAFALSRLDDHAGAVAAALRVGSDDPQRRDVLWLLGESYALLKDYDHAVQYYRLLADEFPQDALAPQALYRLAHLLQSREAWLDASQGYLKLVERFPQHELSARALLASGFCLSKGNQPEKAIRDWEQLGQRFPESEGIGEALFRKGVEEIRLGRHDDALASLDRLMRTIKPENENFAEAQFWRATLFYRKNDLAEAEKCVRAVLERQPSKDLERESNFLLGLILQQSERLPEAADTLQKLIDDPLQTRFTPAQLAWLAEYQQSREAFDAAEAAARRLVVLAPDETWKQAAWTLVGRAAMARKDAAGATEAFEKAVAAIGNTRYAAEAHLRLGELYLAAKNAANAETHFRKAAEIAAAPELQSIRITAQAGLGRAMREAGDRDGAARYLLSVCLLYTDPVLLPPLFEETITLLRLLGRADEAATLEQELCEQYPGSPQAKRMRPAALGAKGGE